LKKKCILIISISFLILLYTGCSKPDGKQTLKPFNDIPVDLTKRIEFSNLTITSSEKESGRSKMITDPQNIQDIAQYLTTISGTESNQKNKEPDFAISFIDNTENQKSY
jgi:PBP1b-binding outer membrane lipoprotein LpoB